MQIQIKLKANGTTSVATANIKYTQEQPDD